MASTKLGMCLTITAALGSLGMGTPPSISQVNVCRTSERTFWYDAKLVLMVSQTVCLQHVSGPHASGNSQVSKSGPLYLSQRDSEACRSVGSVPRRCSRKLQPKDFWGEWLIDSKMFCFLV